MRESGPMKQAALRTLFVVGGVAAVFSAVAIVAIPLVYWFSEGFTRWP